MDYSILEIKTHREKAEWNMMSGPFLSSTRCDLVIMFAPVYLVVFPTIFRCAVCGERVENSAA